MEEGTPPDWQIFIQPGGMGPDAENLEWLTQTPETLKLPVDDPVRRAQGRTYYERFVRSNSPEWCRRYVFAQYGDDPSGSAVFKESYKSAFHLTKVGEGGLEPVRGWPLIVGLDFGRDPCAIICQTDHRGRFLVLEEIIAEDIGLELQLQRAIRPTLQQARYLGMQVLIIGDPAGMQRSTMYEETSFDLIKRNGLMAYPAPTNDIDKRLSAVDSLLLQQRDGGPAFLVDRERCPTIARALGGGYRYGKTKAGQRKPTPEKNDYSHPMDALQYAALAAHGGMTDMIMNRLHSKRAPQQARQSAAGWT
jgi:hypothetical protein